MSNNANHFVNEQVLSSDDDDAFFDVSEEVTSQERSTNNVDTPNGVEDDEDTVRIRKETAV